VSELTEERRAELIEELIAWSNDPDGFDWDRVIRDDDDAPDEYES
jgi:hypothetical protein